MNGPGNDPRGIAGFLAEQVAGLLFPLQCAGCGRDTGATVKAATRALLRAHAASVDILTFSRVLPDM